MELSDEQRQAVDEESPFIIIDAPAGSGKTEVLALRAERQTTQNPDNKILAVTYTTRAAKELNDRLAKTLGTGPEHFQASTIHAYTHHLLTFQGSNVGLSTDFDVLTHTVDKTECLQQYCSQTATDMPATGKDLREWFAEVDVTRAKQKTSSEVELWRQALDLQKTTDYQGLIDKTIQLLDDPWQLRSVRAANPTIIVDEAQNLTPSQYHLLTKITGPSDDAHSSMAFFGDTRQGIVTFAGADPQLIQRFAEEYQAVTIQFTQNYRSSQQVQKALNSITQQLRKPTVDAQEYAATGATRVWQEATVDAEATSIASMIEQKLQQGLNPSILAPGEADKISPEDIAILGRSARVLEPLGKTLEERGVPVSSSVDREVWLKSRLGKAIQLAIDLQASPGKVSAQSQLDDLEPQVEETRWNTLQKLLSKDLHDDLDTFHRLAESALLADDTSNTDEQHAQLDDWSSLSEAWDVYAGQTSPRHITFRHYNQWLNTHISGQKLRPGVRLMTVHKAQSHQFKWVHLVGMTEGTFPSFYAKTPQAREDELRVFYVACSRATRALTASWPQEKENRNGIWRQKPSPFLEHLR